MASISFPTLQMSGACPMPHRRVLDTTQAVSEISLAVLTHICPTCQVPISEAEDRAIHAMTTPGLILQVEEPPEEEDEEGEEPEDNFVNVSKLESGSITLSYEVIGPSPLPKPPKED